MNPQDLDKTLPENAADSSTNTADTATAVRDVPLTAVSAEEDLELELEPEEDEKDDEQSSYEVASQYKLMWWKFRKHKLAMIAGPLLIIMYLGAIFCEFLTPNGPSTRYVDHKNCPPVAVRFWDENGLSWPFVYEVNMSVNPETFRREYMENKEKKYPIRFFVKGEPYKLLWVIPGDIHLFGIDTGGADYSIFLMGTDSYGRDVFSRIVYGSQISLSFGLISIVFTFVIGLLLGGLSGYLGGLIDNIVMRIIDMILCIPTVPLWMALAASLPREWTTIQVYLAMVLIMSLISWTGLARVVRGKILSFREEDFVMASRLSGARHLRVIFKHLIPSFISYIIVSMTMQIPASILGETSLSFLGLGLQAPVVSWGVMLKDAQNLETLAHYPWLLWPAAFVILTVLMFNFLGDGLRDAADPYK